jgi:hypothetical protein
MAGGAFILTNYVLNLNMVGDSWLNIILTADQCTLQLERGKRSYNQIYSASIDIIDQD